MNQQDFPMLNQIKNAAQHSVPHLAEDAIGLTALTVILLGGLFLPLV